MLFNRLLAHPLACGLALDDPDLTRIRRRIICEKPFLRRIYQEWYELILSRLPCGNGGVLELGSGAGFFKNLLPETITSEIFFCDWLDLVCNAAELPLLNNKLKAVVMTDVLHHIPVPRQFFAEASRCVRPGGCIIMVEPWVSAWSRLIYSKFHYEPFRPEAEEWEFPLSGPLTGANGALPWILFDRDKERFEAEFPMWKVEEILPFMPLRYLISGGVSMRSLMPVSVFRFLAGLEWALHPLRHYLAMFAVIVLRRVEV